MFSKKEGIVIRDNIRRTNIIKFKYNSLLKKSLVKNNSFSDLKKLYIMLQNNCRIVSKKKKNLCLLSGGNNSVKKHLLVSRFHINYLTLNNKLQNFKINSW